MPGRRRLSRHDQRDGTLRLVGAAPSFVHCRRIDRVSMLSSHTCCIALLGRIVVASHISSPRRSRGANEAMHCRLRAECQALTTSIIRVVIPALFRLPLKREAFARLLRMHRVCAAACRERPHQSRSGISADALRGWTPLEEGRANDIGAPMLCAGAAQRTWGKVALLVIGLSSLWLVAHVHPEHAHVAFGSRHLLRPLYNSRLEFLVAKLVVR